MARSVVGDLCWAEKYEFLPCFMGRCSLDIEEKKLSTCVPSLINSTFVFPRVVVYRESRILLCCRCFQLSQLRFQKDDLERLRACLHLPGFDHMWCRSIARALIRPKSFSRGAKRVKEYNLQALGLTRRRSRR